MIKTISRRHLLAAAGRWAAALVAVTVLRPISAWAAERNHKAFEAKSLDDVVGAYGGSSARLSTDILLTIPEIAENGAVVPVAVESKLAGTRSISILVEKNPSVLSAHFVFPEGTDPYVATRVKVAETSNIIALVQTADGYYYAQKLVKVTLGGCGG
ncbi:thiosulfate-binding protein SoxY [Fontimonas thermophila]|uniref:Thiosulfate-binding protein SoxY n=1 Tax=Fontimonas thermophila TaxID=1076937 RepID=A0A1I2IVS6_9GAMM|nr:thiosulfate oxidation carrier protein SoxY [Fontimonas thermophila]SFF45840.1 thiosulfate-binding protein SoxY [Fontimonas thermophila]